MPEHTSLCAFFWRAFIILPAIFLFIGLVLSLTIFALIIAPRDVATVTLAVLVVTSCALLLACGLAVSVDALAGGKEGIAPEIIVEGVKAIKGRFCPLIDIY